MLKTLLPTLLLSLLPLCGAAHSLATDRPHHHSEAGWLNHRQQQGPTTAKSLTIGIWNKAGNVSTYTIGNPRNDWILHLVLDKLREPSPYIGNAANWLASEVRQVSDDARTWEISLREGVRWHDGTELTADDVVFTFEYYRDGPANRWTHHASMVPRLEKVEKLGPYKLRVSAAKPMPNFDTNTAPELPIMQKKQWQNVDKPRTFRDLLIGTGPYKLVDYKADEYYRLKANEDYWNGKPTVDEITLVMIRDIQTLFTALKTGEIDGANRSLPPELMQQWLQDENLKIARAPDMWGVWLDLNLGRKPFDQRDLRRAISLAIDPQPMLDTIMLGQAQSGNLGWPHVDSVWTDDSLDNPHDQEAAASLLEKLGFVDRDKDGYREQTDGSPLDWSLKVSSNQPLQFRAAEMVVKQLAEVGLKAHIDTLDPASFAALWGNGQFDLRLMDITPHGIADQDMLTVLYQIDNKKALHNEQDKAAIMQEWYQASTREAREQASHRLQQYQNRYPNRIMLWYPDGLFAYRWKRFDNYASADGYGIFHKYSFLERASRKGVATELNTPEN
ncbi:MAG: ABC transporter substrate-binding protein [Candidatus Thiodiazotropha sp. (ex Ctena orbiculata)]|nr:ABC transporter substrate-binding protein [Candidatus Thiodiazotropha taylori]